MKIQTSQTFISQRTYDSFYKNWNLKDLVNPDPDILDSGIIPTKPSFKVTLRIPMNLRGINGFMLIEANLSFTKNKSNAITLAILCSFVKPLIFSLFLGFLTSLVFVFPYCFFSNIHWIVPFLAGAIISFIYFVRFYYNIKKISDPYLIELEKKYQRLNN